MKKKTVIRFAAAVIAVCGLMPVNIKAAESKPYTYEISDGNAVIKSVAPSQTGRVSIPDKIDGYTVAEIANGAFSMCRSVSKIDIPKGVKKIGKNAFAGCSALEGVYADGENDSFASSGGVLFNKNMTELLCYPAAKSGKSYSVPDSVTEVNAYAFFGAGELNYISLGSIKKIGEFAFSRCDALCAVKLPAGTSQVGEFAFARCPELKAVLMTSDSIKIGNYVFAYCPQLCRAEIFCKSADFGEFVFKESKNAEIYGLKGASLKNYAEQNGIKFHESSSDKFVPIEGIKLDKGSITLKAGQSAELYVTIEPTGASSQGIIWQSDKPDIVSVANGIVTAKANGDAVVTATAVDGGETVQCRIIAVKSDTEQPTTEDEKRQDNNPGGGGGGSGGKDDGGTQPTTVPPVTTTPTEGNNDPDDSKIVHAQGAYITGYSDGSFRPDQSITRAEAAVIFSRISADYDGARAYKSSFYDVGAEQWFANAVGFAAQNGIVTGGSDGRFRPSDRINRAEFAVMAARFAGLKQDDGGGASTFSDCTAHWARGYITALAADGKINGYADGTFRPGNTITRAEAVKIVNSLLKRQIDDLNGAAQKFNDVSEAHWAYREIAAATSEGADRAA